VALLALTAILLFQYKEIKDRFMDTDGGVEMATESARALNFLDDFATIVLGSTEEINLEDRLRLENEVRALGNKEILDIWQAFTEAGTDQEAQEYVIKLLRLLIAKVREG